MNTVTEKLKRHYHLQPHPEGGWYAQTYKSSEWIPAEALPERFNGDRSFSSAIYFLLEQNEYSAFHRIKSDECWHFYSGDPLEIFTLLPGGRIDKVILGNDFIKGHVFQYIVPANCWFASRPAAASKYCFVGCTVAPGFDFADFEMANAEKLVNEFPEYDELIRELCR